MLTQRQTISRIHKVLKPLVHHGIERVERRKSHMTIRGWQGGGMSRGYHLRVSEYASEIVVSYHKKLYDTDEQSLKPLQAIATALRNAGLKISVYDMAVLGNLTEGNEVVSSHNSIGVRFKES